MDRAVERGAILFHMVCGCSPKPGMSRPMQATMHTAILRRPRSFEIVERPRPIAGPGEAVLKIVATAVCHSDLEMYTGRHPGLRYPIGPRT